MRTSAPKTENVFEWKEKKELKKDQTIPVSKNEQHTVTIEDLTFEGMGVGKIKGYPLFIEDALPGEKVEIKIHKTGKTYGYGKVMNRLTSSTDRVPLRNPRYTRVGITPLQHMSYSAQLTFKKQQLEKCNETYCKNARSSCIEHYWYGKPLGIPQ